MGGCDEGVSGAFADGVAQTNTHTLIHCHPDHLNIIQHHCCSYQFFSAFVHFPFKDTFLSSIL